MKLSDIFKLDLNTGGGNKLFARIMNKYNVPKKEYENVKQEMNSFSGGEDSGSSDVEYYATDMEKLNLFGSNALLILMVISLFNYTYKPAGESKEKYIAGGWKFYNDLMDSAASVYLYAIAFSKVKFQGVEFNTLKDLIIEGDMDISLFDSVFTPITKEEFYDLNNI